MPLRDPGASRLRPTRSRRCFVALVSLVALVGAGCERGDDERSTADTTRADAPAEPQEGGRLRLGVVGAASLDPAQARTVDQLLVADLLFDGLTAHDPESLEPAPAIAESWTSTPDQKQWDFVIRPDATFHNGRPITSADVKYSIERVLRKGSGSPSAELLDAVSGYRAFALDGTAPDLAGVQTPAPNVVRFVLDQPLATLPSILASPPFGIVPRESVEAQPPAPAFGEQPSGSGPLAVSERTANTVRLDVADGRDAYVDGVDLVLFDDVTDAYASFEDEKLDFTTVPPDEIDTAGRRYGDDLFTAYLAELFYGFNLRIPKLSDPRFRQAIVQSVDRRSIVNAIYGGTVIPLEGPVVTGLDSHQDDPCGGRCDYDPERAKELLREVFPDGNVPEIAIDYDEDPTQEAVAKALEASLEEVGIPVALRAKPLREYQDFAISGGQEVFRLGWIGAYPSADAFLPPLFMSSSPSNLTGFVVPQVDEQLRAARAEPDPAKRAALYQAAERSIMEWFPIIPIAQFRIHAVKSPRVHGLDLLLTGSFDPTSVWLEDPEGD